MALQTFSVRYPQGLVAETLTRVTQILIARETSTEVQRYLTLVGEPNVDNLTGAQKAELFCMFQMYKAMRDDRVGSAVEAANQAANQQAEDDFILA